MILSRKGDHTLLRLAVAWGIGGSGLTFLAWVIRPFSELWFLMILPYLSLVLAVAFTLYGLRIAPKPFSWPSLALFDGFFVLFASAGWLLFRFRLAALWDHPPWRFWH